LGAVTGAEKWFEEHIEVPGMERKIPRWLKFLFNLETLADGHFKAEVDKDTGEEKVYWVSPDRSANQYLLDRQLGKPVEKTELEADLISNLELSDEQFQKLVVLAAERANSEKSSS